MIIIKLQPSPFDKVVEYPQNRAIPQSMRQFHVNNKGLGS